MAQPAQPIAARPLPSDRTAYFRAAQEWLDARRTDARRGQRLAWTFAGVAVLVAGLQFSAILALQPLAVPVTVIADDVRDGGGAQPLQRIERGALSQSPAIVQAELARYVTLREGFQPERFALDFRHVVAMSADGARAGYEQAWQANPPGPRLRSETSEARVRVNVTGVALAPNGTAQVVFETQRWDGQGAWSPPQPRTAQLTFRLDEAPMLPRDRLMNPLGIVVTSYQ